MNSKLKFSRYGGYSFGDAYAVKPLGAGQISAAINNLINTANNNRSLFFGNIQLLKDLESSLINAFVPDTTTASDHIFILGHFHHEFLLSSHTCWNLVIYYTI